MFGGAAARFDSLSGSIVRPARWRAFFDCVTDVIGAVRGSRAIVLKISTFSLILEAFNAF